MTAAVLFLAADLHYHRSVIPKTCNLRYYKPMNCRPGCGACCIAVSISSPIPGMPQGKPAGVRCIHLTTENLCALFGRPERPCICVNFNADPQLCGRSTDQALANISMLERLTKPSV